MPSRYISTETHNSLRIREDAASEYTSDCNTELYAQRANGRKNKQREKKNPLFDGTVERIYYGGTRVYTRRTVQYIIFVYRCNMYDGNRVRFQVNLFIIVRFEPFVFVRAHN